ncbi:MAG: hypothetical protein HY716_12470 [Planctomycetes bacterium]|nr:hypothetical protein [Planctomycetota bacterium]
MTFMGWVFLGVSLTCVWGLTIWCYAKVLRLPPEEIAQEPQDFSSA